MMHPQQPLNFDTVDRDPVDVVMQVRQAISTELANHVMSWRISQKEASRRLGITQPRLNDLLSGKIDKFSLDALLKLVAVSRISLTLKIG